MDKKINELIEEMNLEQAKEVLRNVLRKVPEDKHDVIRRIFYDTMNIKDDKDIDDVKEEQEDRLNYFDEMFDSINNGDMTFTANEGMDYGYYDYWDYDGDWTYSDNEGIGSIVDDAYNYGVELVNKKKYDEAWFLFDLIVNTKYVAIDDITGDSDAISLRDMHSNNLIRVSNNTLSLYTIYSCYQAVNPEDRAKSIYEYMARYEFGNISISEAFKLGIEKVADEDKFWDDLIEILVGKEGNREYELLVDAIRAKGEGLKVIFDFPEIIYKTHPKLFLDYLNELERGSRFQEIADIGDMILVNIDDKLVVRSEMALIIGNTNEKLGKDINRYLFEIFKSNSSCINLLRVILNKECFNTYKEEIVKVIDSGVIENGSSYNVPKELEKNVIEEKDYYRLNFFLGNFEMMAECLKKNTEYLGWSYKFINECVLLLLLYLYEGNSLTKSMRGVITNLFNKINEDDEALELFNVDISSSNIQDRDFEIFRKWKENFKMDEDLRDEIMALLKNIIRKRVGAIVSNNHRKSYHKAALLVVAFADILSVESPDDGKNFIEHYHNEYSRRSSFRKELRDLEVVF